MSKNFLNYRHPDYVRRAAAWQYVSDVVSGDPVLLSPNNRETYLPRGRMGETIQLYNLRVQVAHCPGWVADLDEVIAGTILGVQPKVQLDRLGAGRAGDHLWNWLEARDRARRGGSEWDRLALSHAVLYGRIVALIDTNATEQGPRPRNSKDERKMGLRAFANLVHPLNLLNWVTGADGRTIEVLIRESRDMRSSLEDAIESAESDRYLRVTTTGWYRYYIDRNGRAVLESSGTFAEPYLDRDGHPIPPVAIVDREGGERDHVYDIAKLSVQAMRIASLIDEDYQRHALKLLQTDGGEETAKYLLRELSLGTAVVARTQHPEVGSNGIEPVEFSAASTEAGLARLQSIQGQAASRMGQAWPEVADKLSMASGVSVDKQYARKTGPRLANYASMLEQLENEALHLYAQAVSISDPWDSLWIERPKIFDLRTPTEKFVEKRDALRGLPLPTRVKAEMILDGIRAAGLGYDYDTDEELLGEIISAVEADEAAQQFLGSFAADG